VRTSPLSGLDVCERNAVGCYGIPVDGSLIMGDIDALWIGALDERACSR
jgi:hypothetical protein